MKQYGIECNEKMIFFENEGKINLVDKTDQNIEIIELENIIETVKKQIDGIDNKLARNILETNALRICTYVIVPLVSLVTVFPLISYSESLFTTIGIIEALGLGTIELLSVLEIIKDKNERKKIKKESSSKRRLLNIYKREMNQVLEKKELEIKNNKSEQKTIYAYEYDNEKALESSNEYVPVEDRHYFKKRKLTIKK